MPLSEAAGVAPFLPLLSTASPGLTGVCMAGPGLGNRGTHAAGYQVMGCNMSCGDKGIPREGRDSQGGM